MDDALRDGLGMCLAFIVFFVVPITALLGVGELLEQCETWQKIKKAVRRDCRKLKRKINHKIRHIVCKWYRKEKRRERKYRFTQAKAIIAYYEEDYYGEL